MFFTQEKLKQRVEELGLKRYFGFKCIAPFVSMQGTLSADEVYRGIPEEISGKPFDLNDSFVGRDRYLWLEKPVNLLKPKPNCEIVGLFNFGETGHGNNSGFESLLYVDGNPYQGVDSNHQEVVFQNLAGKNVRLTFLLWTGLEAGGEHHSFYHRCKQADIAYLHKTTDQLYYLGKAIIESLELMDKDSEHYSNLINALNRAILLIDFEGDSFFETVDIAYKYLTAELNKMQKKTDITVNAVGHTHIDMAWLWRVKHTREKAQRSFSTVLHLMELYDDYIFLQTQPQLYKYLKDDCPELYKKIRKKISEGKWEPDGGMWVEADCNLISGESIVRQLLYGTRFFEDEFKKKCEYLWLPDVFGYSWALPQILKLCEINTFMTTKITWNQYNSIPHDLFKWRGIDGTEILTYFIDTPEVDQSFDSRYSVYGALMTPHAIIGNWKKFKDKDLTHDTLISYGYGDGGGGVNREMLEMRRAMNEIPGVPNVRPTKAGDYFRKIHDSINNTDKYIHTWDGELYLEYHRGTYTVQSYNKKMNRYLENKLIQAEWLSSVALASGGVYAQKQLKDAWELVLLHQFHDIIPGSATREVYEDSHKDYDEAKFQINTVENDALQTLLIKKDYIYSVYSSNSFGGKELVFIPEKRQGTFQDEKGEQLPYQVCDGGYEVLINVVPFATNEIIFCPSKRTEVSVSSPFKFSGSVLETPYYTIEWNNGGQLTRVFDREAKREVLRKGQEGNVLEIYEDKSLDYDAWDIDIFYTEKCSKINAKKPPALIENGPLKAVVRFYYEYNKSTFVQDMIVYNNSRRIDFKTHADWHESHKLLKAAFYTDIRSNKATYDIQFGHIERPTHWNNSWDWAKFEVCGHKWADISEYGYGVSLLNDCKYGYSSKDNAIKLSLLRAPKYPDTEADMGEHDFTYALFPHTGSVVSGGTIEESNRMNIPAQCVSGSFSDKRRIIKASTNNVQIDAVKRAEDENCLIVRLHECRGGRCRVTLQSEFPVKYIIPCNLLEHNCGERQNGNTINFDINPFEIKSFKLYF